MSSAIPQWPSWPLGLLSSFTQPALAQSIDPNWFATNITVNGQNSSAPATEGDILAAVSYGRQLGRITEALAVLIEERPHAAPRRTELDDFMRLRKQIEGIKTQAAVRRLERIGDDLTTLKSSNAAEYQRVAAALRKALDGAA